MTAEQRVMSADLRSRPVVEEPRSREKFRPEAPYGGLDPGAPPEAGVAQAGPSRRLVGPSFGLHRTTRRVEAPSPGPGPSCRRRRDGGQEWSGRSWRAGSRSAGRESPSSCCWSGAGAGCGASPGGTTRGGRRARRSDDARARSPAFPYRVRARELGARRPEAVRREEILAHRQADGAEPTGRSPGSPRRDVDTEGVGLVTEAP